MKAARALYLFRRDLRLSDNTALNAALRSGAEVLPAFIFDPRQADPNRNPYFSPRAFAFMQRALEALDRELRTLGSRLFIFHGRPEDVLRSLIERDGIRSVHVNSDYTPFSTERDRALAAVCRSHGVPFNGYEDATLSPIDRIKTGQGRPYTVFTPFYTKARTISVRRPERRAGSRFVRTHTLTTPCAAHPARRESCASEVSACGDRVSALRSLKKAAWLDDYSRRRDVLSLDGTSDLSVHHKFGTVSIRETYHAVSGRKGDVEAFQRQLYWRDFYYAIGRHMPEVLTRGFVSWEKHIPWREDNSAFERWCHGETGVPIVDAAMRQLRHTGTMHNRARMIAASFLTKNLLIDWRWGERYFARQLVDYDPLVNNGSWQWSASVGVDQKPLRIFNPYLQAMRYDPEGRYIKRYVEELASIAPKLLVRGREEDLSTYAGAYHPPIVSVRSSRERAIETFRNAKRKIL